jgi:type IV secretory pathway VirB10-like protein
MLNDDVVIQDFRPSRRMRRGVVIVLGLCALYGFAQGIGLFSGRTLATQEELPDPTAAERTGPVQVAEEFRPPEPAPPPPPPEKKAEETPAAKAETPPAKKEEPAPVVVTPPPTPAAKSTAPTSIEDVLPGAEKAEQPQDDTPPY